MKLHAVKWLLAASSALGISMAPAFALVDQAPPQVKYHPYIFPFLCNFGLSESNGPGGTGTDDAFAGYVNIAGTKGLVINLQTDGGDGQASAGIVLNEAILSGSTGAISAGIFKSLSFDIKGTFNNVDGPFIYIDVQANSEHGPFSTYVATSTTGTHTAGPNGFTHVVITAADLGIPSNEFFEDAVFILYPTPNTNANSTILNNVTYNGTPNSEIVKVLKTDANFCPFGFCDTRPSMPFSCNNGAGIMLSNP